MTTDDALAWINGGWKSSKYVRTIPNVGTGIDVDKLYGFQCKDFANAFAEYMGAPFTGGNAIVLWTVPQAGWHKVTQPQAGDVFVRNFFSGGVNYGDTGVVKSVGADTVRVVQQNLAGSLSYGSPPAETTYAKSIMLGYLRRDNINTGGGMIGDTDAEFSRWNKLHRLILGADSTRANFRNSAVGKSWLTAMEILSDHPGANAEQDLADWARNNRARVLAEIETLRLTIADLKKNSCTTAERQFLTLRKQI